MPPTAHGNGYNTVAHCAAPHQHQHPRRHSLRHCLSSIRRELVYIRRQTERDLTWLANRAARCHGKERERFGANRLWDRLDFDYIFQHRKQLPHYCHLTPFDLPKLLKIIHWKATFTSRSDKLGFFAKWKDWTSHVTPILFSRHEHAEKIVWCRPGSGKKRCKQYDLCPQCLWLDKLRLLVQGFGVRSGAYAKAQAWYFITVGITTNPTNSKFRFKVYGQDEKEEQTGSPDFDPYPVKLVDTDVLAHGEADASNEARLLASLMQGALDSLYKHGRKKRGLIDGFRSKVECAFRIRPPQTRVNIHLHAIANGIDDGCFLAEQVFDLMNKSLADEPSLSSRFYPDVLFEKIPTAQLLESAFKYLEKLLPVDSIVADAQLDSRARHADGSWSDSYMATLDHTLGGLLDDQLPDMLTGYQLDDGEGCTRRRKAVGNMVFADDNGCIGREPAWHRLLRQKRKKARVTRTKGHS